MAGIGFELRKLHRKSGIINALQAYAYSTMTTVGPMILCLILVLIQQFFMQKYDAGYLQNELFVATLAYCFIFSIIITAGPSMLVTRYIADRIYEKKYQEILTAYYGSLLISLPLAALIAIGFLLTVEANPFYKLVAYLFFIELIAIWMQNVFLSALKDYKRIFRSFAIAVVLSVIVSYLGYQFTTIEPIVIALLGMDVGFASIIILSALHFEQIFPKGDKRNYFAFLSIAKEYPTLFYSGLFVYSGVYIHTFIYWFFSPDHQQIAGSYFLMPFYDVAVFYAYLSVIPSLILFVVIIETDFYERFVNYYRNVIDGGTFESLQLAKKKMQRTLFLRLGFLTEIQLLFTTLSIALGLFLLPKIGFLMHQLELFIILTFGYFFFIVMFILLHILMYFDDRKGILQLAAGFIGASILFTYFTMKLELHGLGFFLASFVGVVCTFGRLLFIVKNIDYYTYCPQPILTIGSTSKKKFWKSKKHVLLPLLFLSFLLVGCTDEKVQPALSTTEQTPISTNITIDDKRIYERDDGSSITTFYATILPDTENPELDWYGLNRIVDRYSEENLKIILAEGEPNGAGPKAGMFGSTATTANAKISLRGNSARNFPQKSYKVNLLDSAGTWKDQTVINLNKHIGDNSRLRNKLSFNLMEKIPNISSLRTQFVHLYVKDTTAGETTYTDYGLYTHVEQPNKRFLRNHLFDENGYLYKVTFFEFHRYPDQIKSHTDPTYDKKAFETILEIKGREEHDKLIQLLNDINNYDIPINDVMEHYFVEDNFLTWLAVNILMDNMDTDANNFYLYSPLNSNKWLILPWDYDDGWQAGRENENFHPYRAGISNFWGNILVNRYLRQQENVDKLTAKIEELYAQYINEQTVTALLDQYGSIPQQHLAHNPDAQYLAMHFSNYELELQKIIDSPAQSLERYYADLQDPKPFFQNKTVILENNEHVFSWQQAFDLQSEEIYYTVSVAKDPAMTKIIAQAEKIRATEIRIPKLAAGTYYFKVIAEDSAGNQKGSFDLYRDREADENYFGVLQVEVTE